MLRRALLLPEAAELHVMASSVAPQSVDVDLNELAGRGPMCRAFNASKFMAVRGALGVWSSFWACWKWCTSWCCCGGPKHSRRAPRPGDHEERTPRHDLSETESEEEDNPCQADAIAWKEERCKDAAQGWTKLLNDDGYIAVAGSCIGMGSTRVVSCAPATLKAMPCLRQEGACSVEGCEKAAQTVRGGVKLCKLHSSTRKKGSRRLSPALR